MTTPDALLGNTFHYRALIGLPTQIYTTALGVFLCTYNTSHQHDPDLELSPLSGQLCGEIPEGVSSFLFKHHTSDHYNRTVRSNWRTGRRGGAAEMEPSAVSPCANLLPVFPRQKWAAGCSIHKGASATQTFLSRVTTVSACYLITRLVLLFLA